MAPDTQSERWFDEAELALMHLAETFKPKAPEPFVSEYLTRPLRTEDEARAQLNRPRIPKARGLADLIAEQVGIDHMFVKLFGSNK